MEPREAGDSMSPAVRFLMRPTVVTLGVLAFAMLALATLPRATAHGQDQQPFAVTVIKACAPGVTGSFLVTWDVTITHNGLADEPDFVTTPSTAFDLAFPISCGEQVVLDGTCTPEPSAQGTHQLCQLVNYLTEEE